MNQIYENYKKFIEMCNSAQFSEAARLLKDIIVDVVNGEGAELSLSQNTICNHTPFDYEGKIVNGDVSESVIVELKISKKSIAAQTVQKILAQANDMKIQNAILVSNSELTESGQKIIDQFKENTNTKVQFFGKKRLDKWFSSYQKKSDFTDTNSVRSIIIECSRNLAKYIASHPEEFMDIEWRDLERIIAVVFSDFGYDVTLTPSAKDGGKDVIVHYKGESYIIEIKHWKEVTKVGKKYIKDFLKVVVRENSKIGLYLSSSGYTTNAFETLSEIEKVRFRHGDKESMQTLLKMYERINNGIYIPINNLEDILTQISNEVE